MPSAGESVIHHCFALSLVLNTVLPRSLTIGKKHNEVIVV